MDNSAPGTALPFITFDDSKGFVLNKEAEEFLQTMNDDQIGVISIVGKYRTGKSFFINRVLLDNYKEGNGFNVGPTINPCTKGLWLWSKPLESNNPDHQNMKVLLIDTEGFAGIDENANHDTRIFLFSLLLSSFFIYNSVGSIDENALQNLSLVINLAKEIQIKSSGKEVDPEEMAQHFPSFLWVVRDFALKLVDTSGHKISPKEYLENSLNPQKGVSDAVESKNRVRRLIKHFFRERDCSTMVRPLENEKDLQRLNTLEDEFFRPEFLEQTKQVQKKIFKKVKPKQMNGRSLTGGMLLEVTKAYLKAINSGSVPNIENAWTYLCQQESQKALEESIKHIESKLDQSALEEPMTQENMSALKNQVREEKGNLKEDMVRRFKQKSLGNADDTKELMSTVDKQFNEQFARFKEKNVEKWKKCYQQWINENDDIEAKLKNDDYKNYFEFQHQLDKLKDKFDSEAPNGVKKDNFWKDYCLKILAQAAQSISKSTEEELTQKLRRLEQKHQMTENELNQRKSQYETEREQLYTRMHEVERERAVSKAQESNNVEKLDTLKREKDRIEEKYKDLSEKYKTDCEKQEKEYKSKIEKLEDMLDKTKVDSNQKSSNFDKKVALLEQELNYVKRDNDNLTGKLEKLEQEKQALQEQIRSKEQSLEEMKKRVSDTEANKEKEINNLRLELDKKVTDLQNENAKRLENAKHENEWQKEKMYLENQVSFLKSQLEENKRLHDALLIALEQNLNNNEQEGKEDLVETNKNLSSAVERMESRCKVLEDKNDKLRRYKKMVKNAKSLQCTTCSKFISTHIFLQHISDCSNQPRNNQPVHASTPQNEAMQNYQSNYSEQQQQQQQAMIDQSSLSISINQTMVKESPDSKPYTEYLIQISHQGKRWSVSRKYKMFCELHQRLNTEFPTLKFPESAYIILGAFSGVNYASNSKRPTVIEERRKALQQYLRDLSKIDIIRNSLTFQQFLELEKAYESERVDTRQSAAAPKSNYQPNTQSTLRTSHDEQQMLALSSPPKVNNNAINRANVSGNKNDQYYNNNAQSSKPMPHNVNNHPQNSTPKGDNQKDIGFKVDKKMFSQSPQSFLKNWQEKVNKENSLPQQVRVVNQAFDSWIKKQSGKTGQRQYEDDQTKVQQIDLSSISGNDNGDYGYDAQNHHQQNTQQQHQQPLSSTHQIKGSEPMNDFNNQAPGLGFASSNPFGSYLKEKGFSQTYSNGGKPFKQFQYNQVQQQGGHHHQQHSQGYVPNNNNSKNSHSRYSSYNDLNMEN